MKKPLYSEALDAEDRGDLQAAASYFVGLSAYLMSESSYENSRSYREAAAYLLRAVGLDIQAGRNERAADHLDRFGFVFEQLSNDERKAVFRGFGNEWLADAMMMVGTGSPEERYERARQEFATIDLDTRLHWSSVPEYDAAYQAMRRFFESQGIDYYQDHDIDFVGRIDWKEAQVDDE